MFICSEYLGQCLDTLNGCFLYFSSVILVSLGLGPWSLSHSHPRSKTMTMMLSSLKIIPSIWTETLTVAFPCGRQSEWEQKKCLSPLPCLSFSWEKPTERAYFFFCSLTPYVVKETSLFNWISYKTPRVPISKLLHYKLGEIAKVKF